MQLSEKSCASVKSRKYKNIQCPFTASHGEFCHRHYKNPLRFLANKTECHHVHTRSEHAAVNKIQRTWKFFKPFYLRNRYGPTFFLKSLSSNDSEIYTLETIDLIPKMYYFSYADSFKNCWTFDLRSLNHLLLEDTALKNPYTREPFPKRSMDLLKDRIHSLTAHKQPIFFNVKENLTSKQIWNQKVLDLFLKMDSLGYRASTQWFEQLNGTAHESLYRELFLLWNVRIGLTMREKDTIVPGHLCQRDKLFRWNPDQISGGKHDLPWWRKQNLELLLKFISSAGDKGKQSLGALYVLMGFSAVVEDVKEAYPWISEI